MFFVMMYFFAGINILHAQWVLTNVASGGSVRALLADGTNLFSGAMYLGVSFSANNGTSWTVVNTGLVSTNVRAFTLKDSNLFAGTSGGVSVSTNKGTSWTTMNSGLPSTPDIRALAFSGTNLFAGTSGGVFLSTNNGASWTAVNSGLVNPNEVRAFAVNGTNLFSGSWYIGLFLSTNNGTSWSAVNDGLYNTTINSLAVHGSNLFAGTSGGVYVSANSGTSWTAVNTGLTNTTVRALAVSGTNLFAGTFGGGVFRSTNNGVNWTAVSTGLTDNNVNALTVSGLNLFAGTESGGVWRRAISEMITSVEKISVKLPTDFILEQNYPNPFNPSTQIEYHLAKETHVTLSIFDALGRSVATLVDEVKNAGTYSVPFSGNGLASGMYLYRMNAGEKSEMRRMMLVK